MSTPEAKMPSGGSKSNINTGGNNVQKRSCGNLYVFKFPRGFFRVLDLVFSIIVWSLFADVTNVTQFTEFQYVIGACILEMIYSLVMMCTYFWDAKVASCCEDSTIQTTEMLCDFFGWLMLFAAFIVAIYRCASPYVINSLNTHKAVCYWQEGHNIEVAIIFLCFLLISMGNSVYWSYRLNTDEIKRGYA